MFDRMPGQRYQNQSPVGAPETSPTDGWRTPSDPGAPVAVQRYRSGAPLIGMLAALGVIALAVILVVIGTRPQPGQTQPSSPSASPTPSQTVGPTPSPGWQGIEFATSNLGVTGYWQVSPPSWDGDSVTVTTTVESTKGTLNFTFFVLNNTTKDAFEPTGGTAAHGSVAVGASQTGTVSFQMPRGDFTLYLASDRGFQSQQIAALVISG